MIDLEIFKEYERRYTKQLSPLASNLAIYLTDCLEGTPRIDRIAARAKAPDRFIVKASKKKDGIRKYADPLSEIQDQVAARIIVFYLSDVDVVEKLILTYFNRIEIKAHVPESEKEFGYEGRHLILAIPEDLIDDTQIQGPQFFELQIKTLFQHAWSEAEHDLSYKSTDPLSALQRRQIAFTAAQAWGADQMFSNILDELSSH